MKEKLALIGFWTEFKQQKLGGSGVNDLFIITCSACHVSFCTSSIDYFAVSSRSYNVKGIGPTLIDLPDR